MKKCCNCKLLKDESEFYNNRAKYDGLSSECKLCSIERVLNYIHTKQGRAVHRKATRKYKQCKKYKEYNKKYNKQYHNCEEHKHKARMNSAKRRGLGYNPLCENPYPNTVKVAYHHIDHSHIIPIPFFIHRKFEGRGFTHEQHIELISAWIRANYPIKNILDGIAA